MFPDKDPKVIDVCVCVRSKKGSNNKRAYLKSIKLIDFKPRTYPNYCISGWLAAQQLNLFCVFQHVQ